MHKRQITYKNFDGTEEFTDTFYFALNKAEIVELQLSENKGFVETIQDIIKEQDGDKLIQHFKNLVLKSFGERSQDGRSFEKSPERVRWFSGTNAYSDLFFKLATDAEAAAEFVRAIVPPDMEMVVEEGLEKAKEDEKPKEWDDYTQDQLLEMSQFDFDRLVSQVQGPKPKMLMTVGMMRKSQQGQN